jgi:anti-sigma28 factor (negative regulator of flagellin synthesis)
MNSVNPIQSQTPIQKIVAQPIRKELPASAVNTPPIADRLEISGAGQFLKTLKANDVRVDKVATIRAQLDAGTYESDQKLNVAVGKLLDELNG